MRFLQGNHFKLYLATILKLFGSKMRFHHDIGGAAAGGVGDYNLVDW